MLEIICNMTGILFLLIWAGENQRRIARHDRYAALVKSESELRCFAAVFYLPLLIAEIILKTKRISSAKKKIKEKA